MIDVTFREADFAKFYQDVGAARASYEKVVDLCSGEFAEGNEKLLGSAHFSLGSLLLEMSKRDEARVQLEKALTIQKQVVVDLLTAKGNTGLKDKAIADVTVEELCKPSIFDDDEIKMKKAVLGEIRDYINDCLDQEAHKFDAIRAEAEKRKAEGFGVETDAPKGFGEKPADADEFKPVVLKSKKRSLEEATQSW